MTDHTRDSRLKTLTPQDVKETTIVDVDELDTTDIAGDTSPHFGGRAQPGDILGIETGGETTASAIRRKMRTSAGPTSRRLPPRHAKTNGTSANSAKDGKGAPGDRMSSA